MLAALTYLELFLSTILIILWVIWFIVALLLLISPLRYLLITKPFLRWFQREEPPLSVAEQQVLDAGGIWWEGQLFSGEPDWQSLFSLGKLNLNEIEQAFLDNQVSALCDLLDEWRISYVDYDLSPEAWEYIKVEKFWGLEIDPKYGGHGFSALAHSSIISKIASRSLSAAIMVMVPNSLGPAEFIKHYGTDDQKNYYLPRLASGLEIPCFALTGIEAGSDAASISDTGVVCYGEYDGQKVLGLRLNWSKRYITLAPITTLIGLAFNMLDPDRLLGSEITLGITLALIPAHLPGIEKGARHYPANMGFMNGPLQGAHVFVPLEQIIGGIDRRGQGWQMMMECLAIGRGISLPSLATAMGKFCFRLSGAYSLVRHQFARPISRFEGVQEALAKIGGFTYLCEATRLLTVHAVQNGVRPAVASAIAKYHLTELSRQIVNHSMDIYAGRGIQLGPRNYLSFLYNAVPVNITVEGANILTRSLIIYGQGVMRCHPYLRSELTAAGELNYRRFDQIFRQHMGFTISHFSRLIIYGLTGGRFIRIRQQPYVQQLTRLSNAFVILTDVTLLVLGKRLKIKESLSARLGDVVSHLYMATAVLKYSQDQGQSEDQVFVDWCMAYCLAKIQEAIIGFLANFPAKWLAVIMRGLIFPWGQAYSGPSDLLAAKIAHLMQENSSIRQRLIGETYLVPGSAAAKMELAMQSILQNEELLKKLIPANKNHKILPLPNESYLCAQIRYTYQNKIINEQQRDQLLQVADLCWEAIQVDDFVKLPTRC